MRAVVQPDEEVCLGVVHPHDPPDRHEGDGGARGARVWRLAVDAAPTEARGAPPPSAPPWPDDPIRLSCAWRLRGRAKRALIALLPTAMAVAFDVTAQAVQREDATSPVVIWGMNARNTMTGRGDAMGREPWRLVTNSFVSYGVVPLLVNASCTFVFCYVAGLWYGCSPVLASMSANALKSAMYPRSAHVGANERSVAAVVHANILMKHEILTPCARTALAVLTVAYTMAVAVMGMLDETGDLGLVYASLIAYGFGKFDVYRAFQDHARAKKAIALATVWWGFPFVLLAGNAYFGYTYMAPPWMRLDLKNASPVEAPSDAPPSPGV